jgi:hypothetical protein
MSGYVGVELSLTIVSSQGSRSSNAKLQQFTRYVLY